MEINILSKSVLADISLSQDAICCLEKTSSEIGFSTSSISQLLRLVRLFFLPSVRCDEQFTQSIGPLLLITARKSFDPLDLPASPLAVTWRVYLRRKLHRSIDTRTYYTHRNAVTSDMSNRTIHNAENGRLMAAAKIRLDEGIRSVSIRRASLAEERRNMSKRVVIADK